MRTRSQQESSTPSVLASVSSAASHFFAWLRTDEHALSRACHSAEIVASVDPSIRAWLKAEEYVFCHTIVLPLFLVVMSLSLSLSLAYPSITACLYSLTPHGTSLTIISL
jgi:hypothetical protein